MFLQFSETNFDDCFKYFILNDVLRRVECCTSPSLVTTDIGQKKRKLFPFLKQLFVYNLDLQDIQVSSCMVLHLLISEKVQERQWQCPRQSQ